ncbi:hypothetical protein ABUK63_03450 [Lactococcus lactis]|uniref:hypothetical protein n=1 Tax=Lactococcus lactis TaxID=1358 RepID=UPI0020267BD8|nr:hypothetical protein [Lactococcus lactis]MCL9638848.1 hypothetical protein [Lactococcus lactis]
MDKIILSATEKFTKTIEELKSDFENLIESKELFFANTEASISWIIRGGLDYFANLDSDFLGNGNSSGIPSMQTDHFVCNFYRLSNALNYLGQIWKISVPQNKDWQLLSDIRTLIIHSGEQITKVESLELKDFKDSQLGRIFKKGERFFGRFEETEYDYELDIWSDKKDKSKNRPQNEVDYDQRMETYKDIEIYLNAKDVTEIILVQVQKFISVANDSKDDFPAFKKLPNAIKERVINKKEIDFEKIEQLIHDKKRGGYVIENSHHYWDGFGLKRLLDYSRNKFYVSNEAAQIINDTILERLNLYWDSYNNEKILDWELPSLDIRDVFKKYTPNFELKHYLEGEKLFLHIAPYFNVKDEYSIPDIGYLVDFIINANQALGMELNLDNLVEGVVCDYFVKSIEYTLKLGEK